MCKDALMECEGLICRHKVKLNESFQWMTKIESIGYNCHVQPRKIDAKSIDDPLFHAVAPSCHAQDYFCQQSDSIFIWNKDVIHTCPYKIIAIIDMFKVGNTVHSSKERLFFDITHTENDCGKQIFGTSEGLFLGLNNDNKIENYFQKSNSDINDVQQLSIADQDYTLAQQRTLTVQMQKTWCFQTINLLRAFARYDNEYLQLFDSKGKELIVYSKHNKIYIPRCQYVDEIKVILESINCNKDIAITFKINNQTINGFLQEGNIIKRTSKLTKLS